MWAQLHGTVRGPALWRGRVSERTCRAQLLLSERLSLSLLTVSQAARQERWHGMVPPVAPAHCDVIRAVRGA